MKSPAQPAISMKGLHQGHNVLRVSMVTIKINKRRSRAGNVQRANQQREREVGVKRIAKVRKYLKYEIYRTFNQGTN